MGNGNDDEIENMLDENGEINAIFMEENANELDLQYNFIQGIKQQELKKHSHSDFVDEFGDIHDEIEKAIQYDESIIHEKLRERKRKYEIRRRKEREGREQEQEKEKEEEEIVTFRDELFRIERFVIYRNNLLDLTKNISKEFGINFDYVLMIDMDVYSIDVRTLMNELFYVDDDIDGICIDGIDWMGYTRDTFATVKTNGGWLHYGHDALVNDTRYIYNNQHAMQQRTKFPNHEENRYEKVKSCFGGIAIYKNFENALLKQACRYTLTRDIFFTNYNNSDSNYSYDYWLHNRHHNEYSEQSKVEIKQFVKQYIELLQVFDKQIENRNLIPNDGDICEHIPFHYCLWEKGFRFAISSRAKLYYDKFYPIARNDTNWALYLANRPKFTQ